MARKLVLVTVFILELSGVLSLYITQVNNQSAVYEIKEDEKTHTLTIANTQPEKPVLREIIYYHIIEKPYDQVTKHNNITNSKNIDTHQTNNDDDGSGNNASGDHKISVENPTENDNNNIKTKHYKIDDRDNTIENSPTVDNIENKTDNENIITKKDETDMKDTIIEINNISEYANKPDNLENITVSDENIDNKDESEKIDNIVNIENIDKNRNEAEIIVTVLDSKSVSFDSDDFILNDLGPFVVMPYKVNVLSNENTTDMDNDNLYNATLSENVAGKKENIADIVDNNINGNSGIIKHKDTSENILNLTEGVNTIDSYDIAYNTIIILNTNEPNSDDKLEVIIADNKTDFQAEIEDNGKIYKSTPVIQEFVAYKDDLLINEPNLSHKDTIASIDSIFESENETISKNEIALEKNSDPDYIHSQNSINKDDKPFTIIVEDDDDDKGNLIDNDINITDDDNIKNEITTEKNADTGYINSQISIDKDDKPFIIIIEDDDDDDDKDNLVDNDNNITDDVNTKYKKTAEKKTELDYNNNKNLVGKNDKPFIIIVEDDEVNENYLIDNGGSITNDSINYKTDNGNHIINRDSNDIDNVNVVVNNNNLKDEDNNIDNDRIYNQFLKYIESDYDDPHDGKEGVNFNDRQFTNGHGFQYFYPDPQSQNPSDPAPVDDTIDQDVKEPSNIPEKIDALDEKPISKLKDVIDDNLEPMETQGKKRKRGIATLYSFNEEYAPEDMLKNVMDKASERVKRSLDREGTYGMTLTGSKGEVWNELDNKKDFFGVGADSKFVENRNKANESLLIARTNINKEYNEIETYSNNIERKGKQELSNKKRKVEETNVLGSNKENSDEPNTIVLKPNIIEFKTEPLDSDKTYGMSLSGGQGRVWNDLDDNSLSYDVGEPLNKLTKKAIKDDEIINQKIQAFHSFLNGESSTDNERLNFVEITTENSISREPTTRKLTTNQLITEYASTKSPKIVKLNTVDPEIAEPMIDELRFEEPKSEDSNDLDKTYGMSLTGDLGIVWNDLNGGRVSYHVGDKNAPTSKLSEDDKLISKKIKDFHNKIQEAGSNVEPKVEEPSTDLNIEEPTTKFPKIEPLTEEPIIYEPNNTPKIEPLTEEPIMYEPNKTPKVEPLTEEPIIYEPANTTKIEPLTEEPISEESKTNRPIVIGPTNEKPTTNEPIIDSPSTEEKDEQVKRYGMSLTGDRGIVWNDLNGDRVSYHVGEADYNIEEDEVSEIATNSDLQETLKPIEDDKENLNHGLEDIDNILTEFADEVDESKNDSAKSIAIKIIDLIKEIFENETAKLENKLNNLIKQEVTKQIEDYFATHSEAQKNIDIYKNSSEILGKNEENLEKTSKKRKDCDDKKEKKQDKFKIAAKNIFGNSVGNGNITNIFIFNFNNGSDIGNIKLPSNGTDDSIFTIGNDNNNPDKEEIKEEHTTEATTEKVIAKPDEENIETTKDPAEDTDTQDKDHSNDIEPLNKLTSEIPQENEIIDTSTEKVIISEAIQDNISNQTTETSNEYTESSIDESNELGENAESDATNTINELVAEQNNKSDLNDGPEEDQNNILEVETNDPSKEPNGIQQELNNNEEDLNNGLEPNTNDTSKEINNIPQGELNNSPEEEPNTISEETNDIVEVEPIDAIAENTDNVQSNYFSEEVNNISEKEPNNISEKSNNTSETNISENKPSIVPEPNDISEKPNGTSEKEPYDVSEPNNISEDTHDVSESDLDDISEDLNGVPEAESIDALQENTKDISKELSGITQEQLHYSSEEESKSILEKTNDTAEEAPSYEVSQEETGILDEEPNNVTEPHKSSEELNYILEIDLGDILKDPNDVLEDSANDVSEELNGIPQEEKNNYSEERTNNAVEELSNNISEEIHGILEIEPNDNLEDDTNDVSKELFSILQEVLNNNSGELLKNISEETDYTAEEEPINDISVEVNNTSEEPHNTTEEPSHDGSEEINIASEEKSNNISDDTSEAVEKETSRDGSEEINNVSEEEQYTNLEETNDTAEETSYDVSEEMTI